MRLSAAVVLSFLLLLLVPDTSCDYCVNADEALNNRETSCSIMLVLVYLNGWDHDDSGYVGGIDCTDHRLFISTTSFIRADPDRRIMEQHIVPNYNDKCEATCTVDDGCRRPNGVYSVMSKPEYNLPFYEAFNEFEKMTDIMIYVSSHYANSYSPVNFDYDKSNLELKNSETILKDVNEKGRFFVSNIVYYAPKDYADDKIYTMEEGKIRKQFYPKTESFTKRNFYGDLMSLHPSRRSIRHDDPNTVWIESPGIYRINIATGKMSRIEYDPSLVDVMT